MRWLQLLCDFAVNNFLLEWNAHTQAYWRDYLRSWGIWGAICTNTRQMMIIMGASLSARAQSAKWSASLSCWKSLICCSLACFCAAVWFASFSRRSALLCRSAVSLSTLHRAPRWALSHCRRLRNRSPLCSSVSAARRSLLRSLLRRSCSSLSSSKSEWPDAVWSSAGFMLAG